MQQKTIFYLLVNISTIVALFLVMLARTKNGDIMLLPLTREKFGAALESEYALQGAPEWQMPLGKNAQENLKNEPPSCGKVYKCDVYMKNILCGGFFSVL